MFKDETDHYLPVYPEEYQADLVREEMIKSCSEEEDGIAVDALDFNVDRLESVIVEGLKEGILNTRLIVARNNKNVKLDYPAEKAIVLALRNGVPILIEERNAANKID